MPNNPSKPIKIIHKNEIMIIPTDADTVEFRRKLSPEEVEEYLLALFGTTNLGMVSCDDVEGEV